MGQRGRLWCHFGHSKVAVWTADNVAHLSEWIFKTLQPASCTTDRLQSVYHLEIHREKDMRQYGEAYVAGTQQRQSTVLLCHWTVVLLINGHWLVFHHFAWTKLFHSSYTMHTLSWYLVSIATSQTLAYAAKPQMWNQCIAWCACFAPAFVGTKLYCFNWAHEYEQLAQSHYAGMPWLEIELATSWS